MPATPTEKIRNIVLLSHSGTGKTTLSEAMLFATGVISRMGRVEDGNTTSDWEPEEAKRQGSSQTSLIPCIWRNHKINVIDTPGYADFRGEVTSGLRVADGVVLVVSAPDGVEVGTEQMWQMAQERNLPCTIFVTKMDKDLAEFQSTVDGLVAAFGKKCVPVQVPIGSQSDFKGVINLLDKTDGAPAELQSQVAEAWDRLAEAVAETDDDLATKYLESEELTREELNQGLRQGVARGEIVPVMAGAPPAGIGIKEFLDSLLTLMPSPADIGPVEATNPETNEKETLSPNGDAPLAALVFKTTADPYVGRLSYFRVFGGNLRSDSQLWNANKGQAERIGQVFVLRGKTQEQVSELAGGDIGAVAKLSATGTGDTLCLRDHPLILEGLEFPDPVFSMAVYPKTRADTDKMTGSLNRLSEEDPSLRILREPDTGEVIVSGLGDTHVEVTAEKIRRKFGVELLLKTPKVPYKETIAVSTKVEYKHKKQSGGHGQYGHVFLELEPLPSGGGFEFGNRVVGGSVPREYIPSVEKGVVKSLSDGVVGGYPIVDIKVVLYDGSYHPVDSSGICFEIAGSHALSKGMKEANPVLLEPILLAKVTVPDSYTGDVIGDLNSKRGRILGMTPQGNGFTLIEALVPQAEMLKYSPELRSMTQGRGIFSVNFDHYEEVPQNLVQRIVEQTQRQQEEARV